MTRLAIVCLAASAPMGQQAYEREVSGRAAQELGATWQVDQVVVRTLRTDLYGTVRVPKRALGGGGPRLRLVVGHAIYRGHDVVHRMDLRLPPAPKPEILTVHDVAPWRFPDEGHLPTYARTEALRAEIVICPSQFAADEVTDAMGVREAIAIPNGIDEAFRVAQPLSDIQLAAYGITPPFVLHAGGCTQRKNLSGLADAWPEVRRAVPTATLVLAGPADSRRTKLFATMAGTLMTGRVSTNDLPGLMASASAVVVPSLYEGFGLPAIEAMAAGTPVVAAARGALPEVCGNAAILVEPDAAGLADGLIAVLTGGAEVETLVALGRARARAYTWEASVASHATLWRRFGVN